MAETGSATQQIGFVARMRRMLARTILGELRWSYAPPLMVYLAYGIQALTGVVSTFVVKDYLGLSAEFLAALGFWVGIPWALKMPLGHIVDLVWKHKAGLVYLGALLVGIGLAIMIAILLKTEAMQAIMPMNSWFVLASILMPVGYVLQDVVADAMTVEAVPRFDEQGQPVPEATQRLMHTTVQTLGRVALIGGGALVSLLQIWMLSGVENLPRAEKTIAYANVYLAALMIPLVSISGVLLAGYLRRKETARLRAQGVSEAEIAKRIDVQSETPNVNWWILGGGLLFAVASIAIGLQNWKYGQEIIFALSMTIVLVMLWRLLRELEPDARLTLVGTAIIIFVFRALPGVGPGWSWFAIDELKFDEAFLAKLGAISSWLTLLGLFVFRRFMGERSIYYILGALTIIGTILILPSLGMYHGLHKWTAAHTGGMVDARFIALIDTAIESPLGQVAMVPMLAWVARSAPRNLKATYFAVMASFSNLALSLSNLGTKYMNQIYTVKRAVKDPVTGAVKSTADYSQLGELLVVVAVISFVVPMATIFILRTMRLRSA
jgi:hypothetical protein